MAAGMAFLTLVYDGGTASRASALLVVLAVGGGGQRRLQLRKRPGNAGGEPGRGSGGHGRGGQGWCAVAVRGPKVPGVRAIGPAHNRRPHAKVGNGRRNHQSGDVLPGGDST
jgi:hypothetical protein